MASIFETDAPHQGQLGTEKAHRKVELQSPKDLSYLIANVNGAAREKIDTHFPPDAAPEKEDAMRIRVEQLVDDYIRNIFSAAKDNMEINGMESKEMEAELAKAQEGEEIEPFDAKLAQRVQELSAQIESHTLQLANLRRNAPAETLQRFHETWKNESEQYDAQLRKGEEGKMEEARNTKLDVGEIERLDEVQNTLHNGTENLNALKSQLGGTIAKMERAQQASNFVQG